MTTPSVCRQASGSDPRATYEQSHCNAIDYAPAFRQVVHSESELPSCGNQPAHIRLTRVDKHARHPNHGNSSGSTRRRSQRRLGPPPHPIHLTHSLTYETATVLVPDELA